MIKIVDGRGVSRLEISGAASVSMAGHTVVRFVSGYGSSCYQWGWSDHSALKQSLVSSGAHY